MFYSVDLLSLRNGRGKLSKIWLAATLSDKLFKQTIPPNSIQKIVLYAVCEEVMNIVDSRDTRPSGRFSLYLSSQLLFGITKIFNHQVIIFLRHFEKTKKELFHELQNQKRFTDGEALELLEVKDIPTPVFPAISQDKNLLHEALEPDLSVINQMVNVGRFESDLHFGALTEQEVEQFYGSDILGGLENLSIRKRLTGAEESGIPLQVTTAVSESDNASHIFREENIAPADVCLTPTKRLHTRQSGTPTKKKRLSYEGRVERSAHAAALEKVLPVPLSTEEIAESALPLPLLDEHSGLQDIPVGTEKSAAAVVDINNVEQEPIEPVDVSEIQHLTQVGRKRKGKFFDKHPQLKKDIMQRIMTDVKYATHTHEETRVDPYRICTSAAWLLLHPSRKKFGGIRTLLYREYWYNDYQIFLKELAKDKTVRVLTEAERTESQYEDIDQPRAYEDTTSHEHEMTNKSKDVIVEQSKKELTIDTTDPSKVSEKILLGIKDPQQSVQSNDTRPDPEALEANITDGLVAIQSGELDNTRRGEEALEAEVLPSVSHFEVPTLGDSVFPEGRKRRDKEKQHISAISSSESSISIRSEHVMWVKSDLSAILEVYWKDMDDVNFLNVVQPETSNKHDALICFEFILELVREGKVVLKQETFGAPLYVLKGKQ